MQLKIVERTEHLRTPVYKCAGTWPMRPVDRCNAKDLRDKATH